MLLEFQEVLRKHYSSVIKCIADELLGCDLGVCTTFVKLILPFALSSGKPCALHSCAHYNLGFYGILICTKLFWLFMSDWLRMMFHNGLNAVIRQWYVLNCLFACISMWDFIVVSLDGISSYRILVYTGNKLFAGTDANVHIEIFGEKGDTGDLCIKSSILNYISDAGQSNTWS